MIEVEKEVMKYFGEQKYYNGFVEEEDAGNCMRMTFLTGCLSGFARWYMLFGEKATIIEPLQLNEIVAEIAENILKKVEQNQVLLT